MGTLYYAGTADGPRSLQQQLSDSADPRIRGDSPRDDSRRARYSVGRASNLGQDVRQWFGDSRGRWEGDTLVVDTTNFTDKASYRGSTEGLHLVERFTRIDAGTVKYAFTIDDATTFTKPWTAAIPMTRTEDQIFEYACHEGNYGMVNLLSGARVQEKAAEEAAKKGSK